MTKRFLNAVGALLLAGCGPVIVVESEAIDPLVVTSVASGETISFIRSNGTATAAVYESSSGKSFSVFVDDNTGRPTEAVANGVVLRFTNWASSSVDVVIVDRNGNASLKTRINNPDSFKLIGGKSAPQQRVTASSLRGLANAISIVGCAASIAAGLTVGSSGVGVPVAVGIIALGCDSALALVLGVDLPSGYAEAKCAIAIATGFSLAEATSCATVALNHRADYLDAVEAVAEASLPGGTGGGGSSGGGSSGGGSSGGGSSGGGSSGGGSSGGGGGSTGGGGGGSTGDPYADRGRVVSGMLLSDGREAGVWGDPERMVGPPDSVGSNLVCGIRPSSCNATIALEFDNYISNGLGDDLRIWGVSLRDNHLAIVCGFEGHEFEIILTPVSGSAALSVSFGPDDWRCNRGDGHWNFDLTDVGVPVSSQLYAIEIRFSLTISTGITRASPHGFEVLNGAY